VILHCAESRDGEFHFYRLEGQERLATAPDLDRALLTFDKDVFVLEGIHEMDDLAEARALFEDFVDLAALSFTHVNGDLAGIGLVGPEDMRGKGRLIWVRKIEKSPVFGLAVLLAKPEKLYVTTCRSCFKVRLRSIGGGFQRGIAPGEFPGPVPA